MFYEFLIIGGLLLLSPYLAAVFLKGVVICRQLIIKLKEKKGIEKTLAKWQELTPEQRMEADLQDTTQKEASKDTSWLNTPSAEEEIRMMNEAVYKKGLVEPKPTVLEGNNES